MFSGMQLLIQYFNIGIRLNLVKLRIGKLIVL